MNTNESVLAVCQKFINLANSVEKSHGNEPWWTIETITIKEQKRIVVRRAKTTIAAYEVVDGMVRHVLYDDVPLMNAEEFVVLQFALLDMVENYMF